MFKRLFRYSVLFLVFIGIAGVSTYVTLTLFLKGTETVNMPDLKGKHVVTALEILSELPLNIKLSRSEYSNEVPLHHVILQTPEAGSEIKKGREVRLVLSKGVLTLSVPNLKGISVQQARIILEESGLCVGETATTHSPDFPSDVVMAQTPEAGSTTEHHQCVNLLISAGRSPLEFIMPDLIRMSSEDAMLAIDNRKLRIGTVTTTYNRLFQPNEVVSQDPKPGYRVEENSQVNLTINRVPGQTGVKIPTASNFRLFTYRLEYGFLNSRVRIQLNSGGVAFDLFDDFLKPGEEIGLLVPDSGESSLLLFRDDELLITNALEGSEWGAPWGAFTPDIGLDVKPAGRE